jgi:hypothetical protein
MKRSQHAQPFMVASMVPLALCFLLLFSRRSDRE